MPNRKILVMSWLATAPCIAFAHHSLLGYDESALVTIEGEVTSIFWSNPHIRLTVSGNAQTGEEQVWEVEGGSVNMMERRGISPDSVHVGDRIAVSGHPSSRVARTILPVLVTLANGQALALDIESASAFGLLAEGGQTGADAETVEAAIAAADGIFRIWSNLDRHWIRDSREWGVRVHPLREAARLAQESWNQATDDLALQCIPAGLPEAMMQPFPIEFMEQDGNILLHIEEWDNVRTIHMEGGDPGINEPGHLGYSLGRWQGNTLLVNTTSIDYPFLDDRGTPMSSEVTIVERFTLSEDDTRLDWMATVTDPVTYTEPIEMPPMHWEWIPGEELKPYNCAVDDARPWGQRR